MAAGPIASSSVAMVEPSVEEPKKWYDDASDV